MKISLVIQGSAGQPPRRGEERKPHKGCEPIGVEEEVRTMLDLVESGHDSAVEWRALRGFYQNLCKMKQNPRVRNLREMIKPVLSKYGYHVE